MPNNQLKRKYNHDYCAPWKYHITITKAPACPDFSSLRIDHLSPDGVKVVNSDIGSEIWKGLKRLPMIEPAIQIYQYAIMQDHLHLLINVKERTSRHLGIIIHEFKTKIADNIRTSRNNPEMRIFTDGYNDKIIYPDRKLDDIFQYIRQNPYRLAVRKMHPEFFRKVRNIHIDNREIQAYGNLFHLRNPFKYPLVIHRSDTDQTFKRKLEDCLYYAANGGIIVSAFISPREKEIRRKAEEYGGKIIYIHNRPLAERQKPGKHDFELCCQGRMLMISPIDYSDLPITDHPSRSQCLDMNSLAEKLSKIHIP